MRNNRRLLGEYKLDLAGLNISREYSLTLLIMLLLLFPCEVCLRVKGHMLTEFYATDVPARTSVSHTNPSLREAFFNHSHTFIVGLAARSSTTRRRM